MSTFTEGNNDSAGGVPPVPGEAAGQKEIKVSAVIDIPVADTQESVRIANTLTALSNAKPAEYGASSLQTQYLMPERMIRIMLWGGLSFIRHILDTIAMLTDQGGD